MIYICIVNNGLLLYKNFLKYIISVFLVLNACHNESRKQQVSNTQGYLLKGMLDERRMTSW